MKLSLKRFLTLGLAVLLLLSCVACGQTTDDPAATTEDPNQAPVTEGETQYDPMIETKNYEKEFYITGVYYIREWATAAEEDRGDPFMDTVYERGLKIQDHLGVELVDIDAGDWLSYSNNVIRTVQSGDDAYQLVSTHCYQGVTAFLTSDAAYNYADFESVNLDAPYWALDFMEDVKIGDQYLIGYNDFCLTSVNAIVFNKDIMAEYNLTAPYEDVRNKTWTLDKLIALASNVAKDNGDGKWDEKDTYGISGWGWVDTISFTTACDIKIVDRDETGLYQVAYENNSEKTFAALEKVSELYNGDFAHYKGPNGTQIAFNDGTTMMYTMETRNMTNLRDVTFHFGVLPYPMYNEAQGQYKSLNWNGVMFVPASIKDPEMVGDVLELLAFYTPPVQKAYYEDLLGSKLSDAPEDAEMLDVIWDSVVTDIGMVSANLAGMDPLLYMFPNLCLDGVQGYSSYVAKNTRSANRALEKLFG